MLTRPDRDNTCRQALSSRFEYISDIRRAQGTRYSLPLILTLTVMAIISGCTGQRAISDFIERHKVELIELFNVSRAALPSRKTIAEVFKRIDFGELSEVFYDWAQDYVPIGSKEWIGIDGKVIGGTVKDASNKYQSYVNLVSLFSHTQKSVIACGVVSGDKASEIPVVRTLIDELGIGGAVFTLDALHCQKDTVKTIVESGNDYVIGVKGNQPNLLNTIKKTL